MKSEWAMPGLAITLAWLSWCGSPVRADAEPLADLRALDQFRQQALAMVDQPLKELGAKYQAALEKRAAAAQAEGNLEALIEAKNEIKRIEGDDTGSPELKDQETAKLQKIYLDARNRLMEEIKPKRASIDRKHAEELGALVTRLTKAGMLEDAKRVRGLREAVLANLGNGRRADLPGLPAAVCRSLVLHFPFDGDRGDVIADCSRQRNNGKAEGARIARGKGGHVCLFDKNSHISVPDAESLDVGGGLTILAWIRLDTLDAPGSRQRQVIVSKHHGEGGKRAFELVFEDAHDGWAVDRLAFNVSASGNPHRGGMINSDITLEKDRWYHVAAVCDPGREMKIYVDGADHTGDVVYRTHYPPAGIATNDLDLRIGLGRDTNGHFLGSMDEVMIFDRALSAGEIRRIHELQK